MYIFIIIIIINIFRNRQYERRKETEKAENIFFSCSYTFSQFSFVSESKINNQIKRKEKKRRKMEFSMCADARPIADLSRLYACCLVYSVTTSNKKENGTKIKEQKKSQEKKKKYRRQIQFCVHKYQPAYFIKILLVFIVFFSLSSSNHRFVELVCQVKQHSHRMVLCPLVLVVLTTYET